MSIIELAPSMFRDIDSYNEAVDFYNARAVTRPELRVITYTDAEYQRKNRRQENSVGDDDMLS